MSTCLHVYQQDTDTGFLVVRPRGYTTILPYVKPKGDPTMDLIVGAI